VVDAARAARRRGEQAAEEASRALMKLDFELFDFDSHYYEPRDAFTRYADRRLGSRGVQWVEANGRPRLLVGGKLNRYIANPTFDPVSRPGALYHWYRGNPDRLEMRDAFGELEPIRPEYRDRDARLATMDRQGVAATLLFPTLGVGIEEALRDDPEPGTYGRPARGEALRTLTTEDRERLVHLLR
jgi:hypothetical protein